MHADAKLLKRSDRYVDVCGVEIGSATERWRRRCTVGIILTTIRNLKNSEARVTVRSRGGKRK